MPRGKRNATTVEEMANVHSEEIGIIEEENKGEEMYAIEKPMVEQPITVENERAQELVDKKIALFIDGPALAKRVDKSYMTILNWVRDGRIQPDGYVNDKGEFKPNNAIYFFSTAEGIREEVEKYGRPAVKSEVEGRKF